VHIPAAVDKLSAQRVGNDVYLAITIPTQNIDASTPADISRIDVFAATALTPPPRARFFEIATKVTSIDVQPTTPLKSGEAPPPPVLDAEGRQLPAQGATITIRDAMTPADLAPKELAAAPTPRGLTAVAPAAAPPAPPFPRRYYMVVASSDRDRQGPPGTLLEVPLPPLPDPPGAPTFTYSQDAVRLTWDPSGGVVGFLFENAAAPEPSPVDEPETSTPSSSPSPPAGPTLYNVYRELPAPAAGSPSPAPPPWQATPPPPLNANPLAALTYNDSADLQFDRERCYTVRGVRGSGNNVTIGPPSERVCMTPVDIFPPEAPTGLSAIAADGVISLLWEPNGEADLAGYVVLRGRAGDATLQPLNDTPLTDTRYADRNVMPGVRYVYAVIAVDTHKPRNVSKESNRVEETAR
jgi:hypothetical protein